MNIEQMARAIGIPVEKMRQIYREAQELKRWQEQREILLEQQLQRSDRRYIRRNTIGQH